MLPVQRIEALDDPRLDPYRSLRYQRDSNGQDFFVAEGDKVVRRLLESDLTVTSVLMPPEGLELFADLLRPRLPNLAIYTAERNLLTQLVGYHIYQGFLATARPPVPPEITDVFENGKGPRLWVAADELCNAENMGGMIRTTAAFGGQAVVVGETCSPPYLRRSVRTSMGTCFKMPLVMAEHLPTTLQFLRTQGMRCLAAHPHTDQKTIFQADLTGDVCLVFGSEGNGLRPEVLAACDEAVAIPMAGGVDSLNVGSAVAAFLCEAFRQRLALSR